jgi:hypothetical protein
VTIRLCRVALDHWRDLDGWAVAQRLKDLRKMPLDRFVNLVWYWATKDAPSEADLAKFEAQIWRPLPGMAATEGPWSPEAENAALASLKAGLGGGAQ